MRAMTPDGFDARPLCVTTWAALEPTHNEVLARVHASSVNPVDAGLD